MTELWTPTKVLITVKTYPFPSTKYKETVCTAGITEEFSWVRLYPIDFRYQPPSRQFKKYQWIKLDLHHSGSGSDQRMESRRPNLETIEIISDQLSIKNNWAARREIISKMPVHTLNELGKLYEEKKVSLGIVKPTSMIDLIVEKDDEEWGANWKADLKQFTLFGIQPKELKKIPYKFKYVFKCEDNEKPHKAMISDWELGVRWLRVFNKTNDEAATNKDVKEHFLNVMCDEERDTHFYMGTVYPFNTWIVVGVYYPPKTKQISLL